MFPINKPVEDGTVHNQYIPHSLGKQFIQVLIIILK